MSLVVYCRCHVTDKQRSALDIKDIRDSYGLLAVTRMSSSTLGVTRGYPKFLSTPYYPSHCKTMVLDISHDTTLAYSVLENFRGLELPRTRTQTCSSRTRTRTSAPRTRART